MGAVEPAALTRWLTLAAALAIVVPATACSRPAPAAAQGCKGRGATMKFDERLILKAVTNGQSGRDIAAAVFAGDVAKVRALVQADPAVLTTHVPPARYPDFRPDGQAGDLLSFAVARCDPAMRDALLQLGAKPDGAVPGLPLDTAIDAHDLDAMRALLAAGASPDPQGDDAAWPLRTAARVADPAAARLLIAHKAKLDRTDATGSGPLQDAVDMDSMQVAEVLIEAGANPWTVGAGGALPAYGIAQPLKLSSPDEEAARQRLEAKLRASGAPWPPPAPAEVKAAIREQRWPPAELAKVGATSAPRAVVETLTKAKR